MTRRTRTWLLLFALLGLLASASSTYIHYRIIGDPTYAALCDINQTFSCESAYTSRYGTIRGLPVALVGVIWFAFVTILLLAARPALTDAAPAKNRFADNVASYVFLLSTVALGTVLFLGYASFFVLKTVCLFCVLTYVASIGLYVLSGHASDAPLRSIPGRAVMDLRALVTSPVALAVAVVFVAGAVAGVGFFPRPSTRSAGSGSIQPPSAESTAAPAPALSPNQQAALERFLTNAPRVSLPVPTDGAKVVIVKFNDFQCPACADSYFWHKQVLAKYQGSYPREVKFVLVDYPLAPECNPSVTTVVHAAACAGAVAVRLARTRGKEVEMEEWLYSHQPGLTPALVRQAAMDIAGITDFDRDYERLVPLVRQEAELGARLNVSGTPTFVINGVKIDGALRAEFFDAAILYELRKAGVATP
jgi:uncharacterized membrane protein/protein-disulfide isomerase